MNKFQTIYELNWGNCEAFFFSERVVNFCVFSILEFYYSNYATASSLFTYFYHFKVSYFSPQFSHNFGRPKSFLLQPSFPSMWSAQQLVAKWFTKKKSKIKLGQLFFSSEKIREKSFCQNLKRDKFQVLTPRSLSINWLKQNVFFRLVKITRLEMRCFEALGDYWRISTANTLSSVFVSTCFFHSFFSPFFSLLFNEIFLSIVTFFTLHFQRLWSAEIESKANVNGPNSVQ